MSREQGFLSFKKVNIKYRQDKIKSMPFDVFSQNVNKYLILSVSSLNHVKKYKYKISILAYLRLY